MGWENGRGSDVSAVSSFGVTDQTFHGPHLLPSETLRARADFLADPTVLDEERWKAPSTRVDGRPTGAGETSNGRAGPCTVLRRHVVEALIAKGSFATDGECDPAAACDQGNVENPPAPCLTVDDADDDKTEQEHGRADCAPKG